LKGRRSLLFVNKKKQKNFVNLEFVRTGRRNANEVDFIKVFCFFFSKKMLLSFTAAIAC